MGALGNPMYGQNKFDASADGKIGEIKHVKPASDGTVASPTATLTASESGNVYVIDISANTAAFVLPDAGLAKGSVFTFLLGIESDGEATKDLIVASGSATQYILGASIDGGTVHDTTAADDQLTFDTSAGACVIKQRACWFFGNAIVSLIESSAASNITILSKPKAIPPWGGAPIASASSRKPNCSFALFVDSPIISST